jgi:hypothetical protein
LDTATPFDLADAAIEGYIYQGDNVVLDFLDADGSGSGEQELARRYLFGLETDQFLAQEDADTNDVLWPLPDNQGTTRDRWTTRDVESTVYGVTAACCGSTISPLPVHQLS